MVGLPPVRGGLIARPGYVLVFADYQAIEFRVFASYAADPAMLKVVTSGGDPHAATARAVFETDVQDHDKSNPLRDAGKTLTFTILFGGGADKVRQQIRKRLLDLAPERAATDLAGIADMTRAQARALLQRYYRAYPGVRSFMRQLQGEARRAGRVVDVFGREYRVPAFEGYKAVSRVVQGTAATVMKMGMLRLCALFRRWRRAGTPARLLLPVHDEFISEVGAEAWGDRKEGMAARVKAAIEDRSTLRLPLTATLTWSATSWVERRKL